MPPSNSPGESSLSQTALTAALGATFAYYVYVSLRQTAHEITPRSFSQNSDAVLSLINFATDDAEQLALILPSWTGIVQHAEIADVVLFPDDNVNSDLQQAQSDARQGFHTIRAANRMMGEQFHHQKQERSGAGDEAVTTTNAVTTTTTARPATLAMKTTVEIAGNRSIDVLLSPIELARKAGGKLMEVSCIIALCTGPDEGDVDVFQKTVQGKVCDNVKYLEKLAAIRKNNYNNNNNSNESCFAASNFLTVEDLFEPYEDYNAGTLLDDREIEWYKLFSKYLADNNYSNASDQDDSSSSPLSFTQLWRKAKLQSEILKQQENNNNSNGAAMSSLLVAPWKYRTYIELAHFIMYGQNERKFGSLFSGVGRGLAHGAHALKRFFTVTSATGSLSEGMKKIAKGVGLSENNNNNNSEKTSSSQLPIEGSFCQLCSSDFGYSSDYPLCGRFEVHITVKMTQQEDVDVFKNFAARIGIKIVQIELPVGQHPTQLMSSFYMQGTVERCTSGAWDFASQIFLLTGLEVLRIKLELQVHDVRNAATLLKFQGDANSSSAANSLIRPFLLLNGPELGLCPVRDEEAQNRKFMTPTQYFEFHLKVKIPGEIREGVLKRVKEVCNKYDAHLSKNAFKPSASTSSSPSSGVSSPKTASSPNLSSPASPNSMSSTSIISSDASSSNNDQQQNNELSSTAHTYFYFVTLRLYDMGLNSSLEKLDTLKKALEEVLENNSFVVVAAANKNNSNDDDVDCNNMIVKASIHSIQREFAVFDSSAALDKGWIDMRTTSNVHQNEF